METPAPTPIRPLSFAERFWAQARGPETDDVPEPLRSVVIIRHLLGVLEKLDARGLVAMLRQAELEGDLSYASPEQVRGEILDTRSVVFSIGVVLFERLTGRHPFGAENNRPRRIDRIRKGELGSGVNSFPTVAAGLRSMLVRAMSPFPEERWPDLRQVRDLLVTFIAQEAPAPRLPGTDSGAEADGEATRVVRLATDFGRELMQVVAQHDKEPEAAPRGHGPRVSQRLQVPTAGVAAIGAVQLVPARRRTSQATPQAGVIQLRAVPPPVPAAVRPPTSPPLPAPEPSVVTTIFESVDAHAETVVVAMPAPIPAAPPPRMPPPPAAMFGPPQAVVLDDLGPIDLRPKKNRTAFVAIGSAAIGGVIAVALFVLLGGGSDTRNAPAAAASPAAATAAAAVPAAAAAPAAVPAAAAAAAAAAAPAPAAVPAAAPVSGNIEGLVGSAIQGCLASHSGARMFGLSIAFKSGVIRKPYYDGTGSLSGGERSCISNAIKGLAPAGAPGTAVAEYRVHVDASGVLVMTPMGH